MSEDGEVLCRSLRLPNGAVLKNRLAKSAMSEALGSADDQVTTPGLATLYARWAQGGAGLLITGNVMVDPLQLVEPNVVALYDESQLPSLSAWVAAGTSADTHLWIQLNHPGRQAPRFINPDPVAPSAVGFSAEMAAVFATPRPLRSSEIEDIVARYGHSAKLAKQAGFTGVQIHGAHGYLVSQFLSPRTNLRTDKWGGSLHNRMRFAREVYRTIRENVGDDFCVSMKLNSADFQVGGLTEAESIEVAVALADSGIDLLEVSGGTYERPEMSGGPVRTSTREREAYFLLFASALRARVAVPIMLTGGFRSSSAMAAAVASGATDVVGLARPLVLEPDLPRRILAGERARSIVTPIVTGIRKIDEAALMEVSWYGRQIRRLGADRPPSLHAGVWGLADVLLTTGGRGIASRLARGTPLPTNHSALKENSMTRPVALITGASMGIGLELAAQFARHGHDLILVARSESKLKELATELKRKHQAESTVIAMDLAEPGAAKSLFEQVNGLGLIVSVLANNAGYGITQAFVDSSFEVQMGMVNLNITALTELCYLFGRGMADRGDGRIINVASIAAFQPGPMMSVYAASKAYVLMLSEGLDVELSPRGVHVTALCPGAVDTNFWDVAGNRGNQLLLRTSMGPAKVAAVGVSALMRGKAVVIPGLLNRLAVFAVRMAPRWLVARISLVLIRGWV